MSITLNNIVAVAILGGFMLFNLAALPKLIKELVFYSNCGWDLRQESPQKIILQDGFAQRFRYLPIGLIKIRVLVTQLIMGLLPLLMVWHHFRYR